MTDKLAHIREPEASLSTRFTPSAQIASRGGGQVLVQDSSPWRATTCSNLVMTRRCQPESLESIGADDAKLEDSSLAAASPKDTVKQRKDLMVCGEGDLDVERSRMMEEDASLERLEAEQASATQLRMEQETEVARVRGLEFDMIAAARSQRQLEMEVASLHTETAKSMRRQHELENELTILRSELVTSQDRVADLEFRDCEALAAVVDGLQRPEVRSNDELSPDKLQELQELHNQLEAELAIERRANAELRDAMQQELRRYEDRLAACVEAGIEARLAQWRDCMDERRASIAEQITAGGKELKQGFEAHAENLKDILAQSCRAGMARLTDLEVKAEEFEAGLVTQHDMEDRVNKLDALISDSLQNAAGECSSFRARCEHLESRLNAAMGDTGWTHVL